MARFLVLHGRHVDDDLKTYNKGDIVESNRNLDKMFKNKFQKIDSSLSPVNKNSNTPPVESSPDNEKNQESLSIDNEIGEDITLEFPTAVDLELQVYINKGWCYVIDNDYEEGEEGYETKMRKKEVSKYLESLVSDDDDLDEEESDDE